MAKTPNPPTALIPPDMLERVDHVCRTMQCSRSDLVREALGRYLDNIDNDRFHVPAKSWREAAALPWGDAVAKRAYSLFEQRGIEQGHEFDDWVQSERSLDTRKADRRKDSVPVEGEDRRTGEDRRRAGAVTPS